MVAKKWRIIGLMSGTSLDGLDIVFTEFCVDANGYTYKILNCETLPYSSYWENALRNGFNSSVKTLDELSIKYGAFLGKCVLDFMTKNTIVKVDFIASHGHTIFHKPAEGYTLQIGDGQTISNVTGLKVICDFRTQDVNLGGQGAPLVPIGDRLLFSNYTYCLNLGGFANISFEKEGKRWAYDICPVNIVFNYYAKKMGYAFDKGGKISESGVVHTALFNQLNAIPFYQAPIPKSLGFEFVNDIIFPIIEKHQLKENDIMRTFTAHVVYQITKCLDNSLQSSLLVTGGGAFNLFLIETLKKQTLTKIVLPTQDTINYKEALIFAFLGLLKNENKINCLSSVTGAKKDHSSGKIFTKQV